MKVPELLIGVDIGGTFTDLILFDPSTKKMWFRKILTTSKDYSEGVKEGIDSLTKSQNFSTSEIFSVIHGSTIGINTVIERKGAKTGLITTKGFEDVLLIGRQTRPLIYDWRVGRPPPLIPGSLRKGLCERISHSGEILVPLDSKEVTDILRHFQKKNVEAIAVCLLHSYADSSHESKVKKVIENNNPNLYTSISSELLPEFREYERMSTTVINSYIGPELSRYLGSLNDDFRSQGVKQLLIMKADGSLTSVDDATIRPVGTIESGPAGGVLAAAYIGKLVGADNIVSFDMGGTTAKCSIIINSTPLVTTQYEVSPVIQGDRLLRGSGYPIKTPVIDLVEVGAGGGSIAWIDSGGALRVGPHSTGADPGPACYGRGGTDMTITDANLILGRIAPDYFLGGKMQLDSNASDKVLENFVENLGLSKLEAAEGILDVANSIMARGIRFVTTERGIDIEDFSLVAFGGAAPVQIVDLAEIVRVKEIIIPPAPGVFSAFGFLVADLSHNYVKTNYSLSSMTTWDHVEKVFFELEEKGRAQLEEDSVSPSDMKMSRSIDMRYIGQSHELNVNVDNSQDLETINNRFHHVHKRHHGYSMPDEEVALVNFRLMASGLRSKPEINPLDQLSYAEDVVLKDERQVYFKDKGWVKSKVYDRELLRPGYILNGPCIVEEWDTSTVINEGYTGKIDQFGNIILRKGGNLT
jgi:N-methylhydantoinase A